MAPKDGGGGGGGSISSIISRSSRKTGKIIGSGVYKGAHKNTGRGSNLTWWQVLLIVYGCMFIILFMGTVGWFWKKEKERSSTKNKSFRFWWVLGNTLLMASGVGLIIYLFQWMGKKCCCCCGGNRKEGKSYEKMGDDDQEDRDVEQTSAIANANDAPLAPPPSYGGGGGYSATAYYGGDDAGPGQHAGDAKYEPYGYNPPSAPAAGPYAGADYYYKPPPS
ncbi:hypothetical protein SLS62_005716 [Diatrype stigma]|uniref:Uncharacterized protein n=1 Tax=Diatrype stigma TaxID=117547 RepID=A0AAN9UNT8_9PEZI